MSSYQGWDIEEMKAAQAAEDDMDREPKRTCVACPLDCLFGPVLFKQAYSDSQGNGTRYFSVYWLYTDQHPQ